MKKSLNDRIKSHQKKGEKNEQLVAPIARARKTFSIRLNPDIYKGIRRIALEDECSISDVVESSLKDVLINHKQL